jgi:hypothetical protein
MHQHHQGHSHSILFLYAPRYLHELNHLVDRNDTVFGGTSSFGQNGVEFCFRQAFFGASNVDENGIESVHLDSSLGTSFLLDSLEEFLAETIGSLARETVSRIIAKRIGVSKMKRGSIVKDVVNQIRAQSYTVHSQTHKDLLLLTVLFKNAANSIGRLTVGGKCTQRSTNGGGAKDSSTNRRNHLFL